MINTGALKRCCHFSVKLVLELTSSELDVLGCPCLRALFFTELNTVVNRRQRQADVQFWKGNTVGGVSEDSALETGRTAFVDHGSDGGLFEEDVERETGDGQVRIPFLAIVDSTSALGADFHNDAGKILEHVALGVRTADDRNVRIIEASLI